MCFLLLITTKSRKQFSYPQLYFTRWWCVQTCWCSAAPLVVVIASSLTRQVYFFKLWERAQGNFTSSQRWSSKAWSRPAVMTLFAPEWQVHQHLLVNVSKERQWSLCSPHGPLGLPTACWLILSFLMSVNSGILHEESVSSLYWRAHLSFCSLLLTYDEIGAGSILPFQSEMDVWYLSIPSHNPCSLFPFFSLSLCIFFCRVTGAF